MADKDSIIFKYSDFIMDDGAFDEARKKIKKFGDDIIEDAKKTKEEFKKSMTLDDIEGLSSFEKKINDLTLAFKKNAKSQVDLNKIEAEYIKEVKKSSETNDDKLDSLIKLDSELVSLRSRLKKLESEEKKGLKTGKQTAAQKVDLKLRIKEVNSEINKNQKEVLESNKLSKQEQKLLKAKITLEKQEVKTLNDVRERMSALRVVVQSLDIDTQADQINAYNQEINDLTNVLSENSDKFIQSKINIGNYEDAIVSALKSSNLFTGELSVLNGAVDKLVDVFTSSKESNEQDTKSKKANTRATIVLSKTIKVLNNVAKATVFVALIAAIASLASVFKQGRAGVIATDTALSKFTVTARVLINVAAEIGKGIFNIFQGIGNSFGAFFDKVELFILKAQKQISSLPSILGGSQEKVNGLTKEIQLLQETINNKQANDKYADGWNKITGAVSSASQRIEDATAAIKTLDEGAIRAFEISDEIKKAEIGLIALRKEVQILEVVSNDSTISLNSQLEATEQLLVKRVELLQKESDISLKNLELANSKARADAEAAGFRLSKDDVKFAQELLDLNIRLSERQGENPLDDTLLEESQNALKDYLTILGEVEVAEVESGEKRRLIQRDIFEQNLDLLIDLIDTEKNISEQFVNDVTNSFKNRINEFNRFLVVFRQNSQKELDEFTKEANNLGLDLDFNVEFDDKGGFKVFTGDTELAINNILKLNEQLQNTGLNEIDINRFREFIIETRNGLRDFKDLNKELTLASININELSENLTVSEDQLNALDTLQGKINELTQLSQKGVSISRRKKILKEIEELEKQKTEIEEFAEFQRQQNRINAIDSELETVQEESERYYELLQERTDIEKQIREKGIDDYLEKTKDANKKAIEDYKKFSSEVRQVLGQVLDKAIEVQNKRVQGAEKQVDKQSELIDLQRRRAEQGLENTLAFEQRELGKREAERVKEQKKQERLEKIKAIYSSYNNYASKGDENPILKALRDFAILESITASFGDGGIVEDKLPTNGIFTGQSHKGNNKGIPILVEGKEGIFSTREMSNLGKDNFYKMKELSSLGKVDSNFFTEQNKAFAVGVPVQNTNTEFVNELRQVKKAIESKPVQTWDASNVVNGTMDLVETIVTKNDIKRNHYKTKKPRL